MTKKLLKEVFDAMSSVYVKCDNFHHKKSDQHGYHEDCKPLARYYDTIKKIESELHKPRK